MERAIVSARAKQEYVQAIYLRYRGARRPEKQRILDEFCQVTGHHRKHAIRLLNGQLPQPFTTSASTASRSKAAAMSARV
jgi:hypothetical protein